MSQSFIQNAGLILTLILSPIVWIMGGRPERITVVASAVAYVLTPVVQAHGGRHWPLSVAMVDLALCAVLLALVLCYDRTWLMAAAGIVLVTTLSNFTTIIDTTLQQRGYVVQSWAYYYLFLGALAYSVVEVRRRRARGLGA